MKYRMRTFTVVMEMPEEWEAGQPLRSAEDTWHFTAPIYADLDADKEHFVLIVCNNKNRYQGHKVISTGTLTAALVSPREVYTAVLNPDWRAAAVIFVHNHPSGDPAPSSEDIDITRRLKEVGEILGIRILDHLIRGNGRYWSFVEKGML